MVTVAEFRAALPGADAYNLVDQFLLTPGAAHVSDADAAYIQATIAGAFNINPDQVHIQITGSAKLGFSLVEKRRPGQATLPRYRAFSGLSDIDVAVISKPIFDGIWREVSSHFHDTRWLPNDTGKLGDYLVNGWWRPDHFPRGVRLLHYDLWQDTFRRLSTHRRFRPRHVNGGPFYSLEHLRQYQARAVKECISIEEVP